MIKRKYHWIPGHAIAEEADKLGINSHFNCYAWDRNLAEGEIEVGMSESEWAKIEAELPHLFEKRVLDLRGVFKRYGMENQSRGMMAWQDIAEDEWGDYVRMEDVVAYLKKSGNYDSVVSSKDKSDDWERADGNA